MVRKIVASKVKIKAKNIRRDDVIRQTEAHHASKLIAKKDVEIEIRKQYPSQKGDSERPPVGTKISGDHATISARKITGLQKIRGEYHVNAEDNVIAHIRSKKEAKK